MSGYLLAKYLRTGIEKAIHTFEPEPVLDNSRFPWTKEVEKYHLAIKTEALSLLPNLDQILNFNDVLPGQRALKQNDDWKSFFLLASGRDVERNQKLCPETTQAIRNIPNIINAFFSILKPGTIIPPHRGPYAGLLRYHLGVKIPQGDIGINVGGQECRWEEGKSLIFDDSFTHNVWNKTNEARVILFVDLERPLNFPLSTLNKGLLNLLDRSSVAQKAREKILN